MPNHLKTLVNHSSATALLIAISLTLAVASVVGQDIGKQPREQIGESLGKPVYRDEIRTDKDIPLDGELHRLFTSAAIAEY